MFYTCIDMCIEVQQTKKKFFAFFSFLLVTTTKAIFITNSIKALLRVYKEKKALIKDERLCCLPYKIITHKLMVS